MKMNITVLAGGISPERDVSLSSGKMIYTALKERGHKVILLDVYLGYNEEIPLNPASLFDKNINWAADIGEIKSKSPDIEAIKSRRKDKSKGFFGPGVISLCQAADIVFIALHGESGENGKIQACFDLMDIKYTGSGHISSAITMDKTLAKELFTLHSVPTPLSISVSRGEEADKPGHIPYPVIVKANSGGSSVGVMIAGNDTEYALALEEAYRYDNIALVEQYIKGREFSVGILAGRALPVIEIAPKSGFFDYHNKYQPGATVETCPAGISTKMTARLQETAEKVYRILRLSNYARIDFMADENEQIYCLEANTLPGMAPTSLLPQEALKAGLDFGEFCEKIIVGALSPSPL